LRLQLLQLHRVLSLLNLVIGEPLQVGSQTESRHGGDEPFGWVVLEPFDGISEVHRELVVEVMVTLADGAKCGEEVVARSVLVVERLVPEPVGKRVDTERRVVDKQEPSGTGKEESALPVSPSEPSYKRGEDDTHEQKHRNVVLVLPPDDLVSGQVRDVGNSDLASRLDEHPSYMRPPETLVGRVRVELGVGVSVVCSMASRPPFDRALNSTGAGKGQGVLQRQRGVVRSVSP